MYTRGFTDGKGLNAPTTKYCTIARRYGVPSSIMRISRFGKFKHTRHSHFSRGGDGLCLASGPNESSDVHLVETQLL
jgi:hypothetical protein